MVNNKINAIILAGTHKQKKRLINENDGKGPKNKALVNKITGKPLILGVLDCLKNSKYINQDNITIIGPRPKLKSIISDEKVLILPEKTRLIDNARTAYDELSINGEKTIFIPSDMLFLNSKTSKTIDNFISQCNEYPNNDFYFCFINQKNVPPEIKQLKISMKFNLKGKGNYRTANLALFEGKRIKNRDLLENQIEKVFENRRTTNLFARYLLYANIITPYWKEIIKHSFKSLTEQDVEKAIKREAGINIKLIETKDIRLVADVDYQKDYEYFKENFVFLKQKYNL